MSREAMQMALDALKRLINYDYHGEPFDGKDIEAAEAIEALRIALATCQRCGKVNPAEIHTCTPKEVNCD